MFTAIAAILGFLSSVAPQLVGAWQKKEDNAHAERMAQLQLEAAKEGHAAQLAVAEAQADSEQQRALYSYDAGPSGSKFVDAFSKLVRPYITMVIFHLWLTIEGVLLLTGMWKGLSTAELYNIVWGQETQVLFGAVMGFWFGQRTVKTAAERVIKPPTKR
jgi:hypothetical protein